MVQSFRLIILRFVNQKTIKMTSTRYCKSVLTFAFFLALFGCNHYFTARPVSTISEFPAAIEQAKEAHRFFVMKAGLNAYTVTSVDLDKAKQQMTVTLNTLDSAHLLYLSNPGSRLRKPTKSPSEIHMYMRDSTSYTLDEPHTIPLNNIGRLQLLD